MLKLQDIMTTDVVTVAPELSLRETLLLFAARHVSGAPVVDRGKVVGVVSQSDLIGFLADPPAEPAGEADEVDETDELDADAAAWDARDEPPSAFFTHLWDGGGADVADRFESPAARPRDRVADALATHTVADIMTHAVFALSSAADVTMAADYMRTVGVHRILVVDEGRLVGIVSASDVARAAADGQLTRRTFVFERA